MGTALPYEAPLDGLDADALAWRALADALPQLVFVADRDGANRFVNRRFREYTGLGERALGACGTVEAIHPDDRARAQAAWDRAVAARGVYEAEYRLRAAEGDYRWHLTRAVPLASEDGAPGAWVGSSTDIDARVRAAEALAAREAQLKLGAELAGLGGYEMEWPDGGVRWAPETYRLHGVPEGEEITIDRLRELAHPGDRARIRARVEAMARGEAVRHIEYRIHRADTGEERHLDTLVHVTAREGGGLRIVGVTQDVTEPRAREATLRESETRFRDMADSAPVMVWVTGADGQCVFLSRSWYAFTGQTPETGLGLGWLDAVHPEDAERSARAFLDANAAGAPFRMEYRLRRADGAYRWALDAAAPRFDAAGLFLGYVGSVIDISERREAELAVAASEEMLRLAQQSAGVGTFDWNLVTDTLVWSDGCKRAFGLPPDEAISYARFREALAADERERVDAVVATALDPAGSGEYAVEYRVIWPSGEERWIDARGRALFDGAGGARRAYRFIGTVLDVTERKRVETELAAAVGARDELLAEVNHRVKNNLAVVNALLGLQAARLPHGDARRALNEAQARVGVVGSVHERLYMSGRHGRIDLCVEGRALVADVLRATAGEAAPRFDFACPGGLSLEVAQAVPVFLILNELVTNAVKYAWSDAMAGALAIVIEDRGNELRIAVADDGVGYPEAAVAAGGGGLGLRIVAALARQLRGRIERPPVERGTAFALVFPLAGGG